MSSAGARAVSERGTSGHIGPVWLRPAVVALAAAVLLTALVRPSTIGWLLVGAGLAAAAVSSLAALRVRGTDRLAWALLGAGQVLNGLGNIAIAQDLSGWFHQAGTASSVAFDLATLCSVAGLAAFVVPLDRWGALRRTATDAVLVLGTAFVVGWFYGLPRFFGTEGQSLLTQSAFLVVLAECLALAMAWLLWTSRARGERLAVRLAVLSLACATAGDTGVAAHLPISDDFLALSWLVSSVVMLGAAAWAPPVTRPLRQLGTERADTAVVLLVGLGVVAVLVNGRPIDDVSFRAAGAVMLLLLARQLHVARQNDRLAHALAESERHFRTLVADSRDLIMRVDAEGRVLYASPAAMTVLGVPSGTVTGRQLASVVHEEDRELAVRAAEQLGSGAISTARLECRVVRPGGEVVHVEAVATSASEGFVVSVRDVTERSQLQGQLREAAYTDALTGLPNRSRFDALLHERFAAGSGPVVMLFCDLDGFKRVNDTAGHAAGDELLVDVAGDLAAAMRPGDLLARFGGDEFTVLLAPGSGIRQAHEVVEAVRTTASRPRTVRDRDIVVGLTVGVAVSEPGSGPEELVRNADLAMYQAKAAGRGTYRVFEPVMYDEFARQVDLERRLRAALDRRDLTLLYQPVVDAATGAVVSAEALLRWHDGAETVLGPQEVVALAESFGSIVQLGSWVLDEAVRQAARWSAAGYPVRIAVNVSARQLLGSDLWTAVDRSLRSAGLPPDRLTIEITESVLLDDTETVITNLERLRALGVRLAVDDFGTGYSGLAYLRRLPVDELKIDRSFVAGLGHLADVTAMVRAVVRLGHDLGLSVTAEGAERGSQLRLLRDMGVDQVQGYVVSRPLDAGSMLECLERGPYLVHGPAAADDVTRLQRAADGIPIQASGRWTTRPDAETDLVDG